MSSRPQTAVEEGEVELLEGKWVKGEQQESGSVAWQTQGYWELQGNILADPGAFGRYSLGRNFHRMWGNGG